MDPAIEREVVERGDNDPRGLQGSGREGVAHYAGAEPIGSANTSLPRGTSRLYRTGFFAIEPTLGVTKDGSIFYQTTDAREWPVFPTDVIRSTNYGRTWKAVGPRLGPESRHPTTEDPYLYVDRDTGRGGKGKVAMSYMGTTQSPGRPFDGDYEDVTWNGYITVTQTALRSRPKFVTASVNDPSDPLIKGSCYARCGAAFDFLDVVIAPDGTPLASFVDGCFKNACDHSGQFLPLGEAAVGRIVGGPSLR